MTGELYLPEITGSGAALFDYGDDGDLDVYLVQGTMIGEGKSLKDAILPWQGSDSPRDQLYRNDLGRDANAVRRLGFTNVTNESSILAEGYGMGVAVGDLNNDGRPDLYVTNLGSNQMFLNQGDETFSDVTAKSGTDDPRWSTSSAFLDYNRDPSFRYTGFGTGWLDFDNDGSLDLLALNGAVRILRDLAREGNPYPLGQSNQLFQNAGKLVFRDVTAGAGASFQLREGPGREQQWSGPAAPEPGRKPQALVGLEVAGQGSHCRRRCPR